MRATLVTLALLGCSEAAPPAATTTEARSTPPREVEAPPAHSLESIRGRSGCAFESVEALCEAFREHYLSSDRGWVSDGCALGEPRTSSGPFAEARLIGIREGHDRADADAPRVERALLGGTVREPPGQPATTQVVLAARVGSAWFPIVLFHPPTEGEIEGDGVEWTLDEAGTRLTWTHERGATRRDDPYGYGETERTLAVVDRGVPMIAARATVERWRSEVDLACTRACNGAPSPPPYPECARGCASSVRETRSWEQVGDTVRIGATEVHREGRAQAESEVLREEAEMRRLAATDTLMSFCAFMPVVRAVAPPSLPDDAESVAARERALAVVRRGTFRELAGAQAAAVPDAPRATLRIDERGPGGCGGGACSMGIRFRTIEGSMPEEGITYFEPTRGSRVGCDPASLPSDGEPTFVEVAPAISREAIGCGFSGYDGTTRRYWVIVRVLEQAP